MMRTYTGVVCEKKNKYMVFLTEKGEFLRGVPIGDPPEIGEEADFTLFASSFIANGKAKQRFAAVVLVAAALLFFLVSSFGPLNGKVMAYVQLDAGTAMEFGVDRKGNVISLRYLNDTPNEPDRLSEWKGLSILSILDKAVMEFSDHDKQVSITTIYRTRENGRETRQLIGDAMQEVRGKYEELNLDITESTPAERKVANKQKMSIHKFKLITHEKSSNGKLPATKKNPSKEKSEQQQNDGLQKPKKVTVPPGQKKLEKEKQNPPAEKNEKKPNNGQSEKVSPRADKKGPPANSPAMDKRNNGKQGPPAKQQKENPSNEKKQNPQNNK